MTQLRVDVDRLIVDGVESRAEAERLAERVREILTAMLARGANGASGATPVSGDAGTGAADVVAARIARAIWEQLPVKRR